MGEYNNINLYSKLFFNSISDEFYFIDEVLRVKRYEEKIKMNKDFKKGIEKAINYCKEIISSCKQKKVEIGIDKERMTPILTEILDSSEINIAKCHDNKEQFSLCNVITDLKEICKKCKAALKGYDDFETQLNDSIELYSRYLESLKRED